MQNIFTRKFMEENSGCYSHTPGRLNDCSFMSSDSINLESILRSEIPLKDKYWFVCKKLATKEQNQQIAIAVSEIVLPIFEKRYPDDKRPREAIEAAKQFIGGHINIDILLAKGRAAAYAAYAAYAAAAAAAAAADADAADAADDAAAAADAAAYAADAEIKQQLLDYLIDFCSNN